MNKNIILTEEQLKNFCRKIKNTNRKIRISETQLEQIKETAKIRPWTDDDYKKANPSQVKDVDFAALKQMDDDYIQSHPEVKNIKGKKKKNDINTGADIYGAPRPIQQTNIDKVQSDLTKNIQQRYMDATGKDTPLINKDELGDIGGGKLQERLNDYGMEIGLHGKTFSYGNSKLPENILIINLTSAWNCPSIKNLECPLGKYCYARKGEAKNNNVQLRNLRNQMSYEYMSVKEILQIVETYIENAPARIEYIRISEDGDFPHQHIVDFCDKIAGHLKAKYGIKTTAYTHRQLNYTNCQNMVINMSDYRIKGGDRYFIVLPENQWEQIPDGLNLDNIMKVGNSIAQGTFKCICDCRKCNGGKPFCYQTKADNGEPENQTITVVEKLRK